MAPVNSRVLKSRTVVNKTGLKLAGIFLAVILTRALLRPESQIGILNSFLPPDSAGCLRIKLTSSDACAGFQCRVPTLDGFIRPTEVERPMDSYSYWNPQWKLYSGSQADGSLKILGLDTVLTGAQIGHASEYSPFFTVKCAVDSGIPSGIYEYHLEEVILADTSGQLIDEQNLAGKVTVSTGQALLYGAPDTLTAGTLNHTWRLQLSVDEYVWGFGIEIADPAHILHLRSVAVPLPYEWSLQYQQDTSGVIGISANSTGPLRLAPVILRYEIVPIEVVVDIDKQAVPGQYHFPVICFWAFDGTCNYLLTTDTAVADLMVQAGSSGFSQLDMAPAKFGLTPNFPNPFNQHTTINFTLPQAAFVRMEVYDIHGARLTTLLAERRLAGYHRVNWDGRADDGTILPSGIYFFALTSGGQKLIRKAVLLK